VPIRAIPRIGAEVTVAFLATEVGGVVADVHDEHELEVLTDEGEAIHFGLNRATGRYLADGRQSGARLRFA
jgi:hypothetical protein